MFAQWNFNREELELQKEIIDDILFKTNKGGSRRVTESTRIIIKDEKEDRTTKAHFRLISSISNLSKEERKELKRKKKKGEKLFRQHIDEAVILLNEPAWNQQADAFFWDKYGRRRASLMNDPDDLEKVVSRYLDDQEDAEKEAQNRSNLGLLSFQSYNPNQSWNPNQSYNPMNQSWNL